MPNNRLVQALDKLEPELRVNIRFPVSDGQAAVRGLFSIRNSVDVLAEGEKKPDMTEQSEAISSFLNPSPDEFHDDCRTFSVSGVPVAAEGGPLLDGKETSEPLKHSTTYRDFAVSGCKPLMLATRETYANLPDELSAGRLHNFDVCRTHAWFVQHKITGKVRVASSRCGFRWCPLCIKTRRYVITQAVSAWLKSKKRPKFLTLTLKHSESSLTEQIDNLYKFFKTLRRRPWFKKRLYGGIWFFQVKKSESDELWHPHLHIVFDGRYLDHDELKQYWREITHTSSIVDIRAIKCPAKAAKYVARYAAAPCNLSDLDIARRVEIVLALHSRRICGTFGNAKVIKLSPGPPPDAEEWQYVGSFFDVIRGAEIYDENREIFDAWKSGEPCPVRTIEPPPPKEFIDSNSENSPEPFRQYLLDFYER